MLNMAHLTAVRQVVFHFVIYRFDFEVNRRSFLHLLLGTVSPKRCTA